MGSNYYHRMTGTVFLHVKEPCYGCIHRRPYGEWEGFCKAKGKVLSWADEGRRVKRCRESDTLTLQASRLVARLRRAWATETVNTRRAWRLYAALKRAEVRQMAREDMGL